MACCGPWVEKLDGPILSRMLSIYEASDAVGSCSTLIDRASEDSATAEIELQLGGDHGAFYQVHDEWIGPVVRWALGGDP